MAEKAGTEAPKDHGGGGVGALSDAQSTKTADEQKNRKAEAEKAPVDAVGNKLVGEVGLTPGELSGHPIAGVMSSDQPPGRELVNESINKIGTMVTTTSDDISDPS